MVDFILNCLACDANIVRRGTVLCVAVEAAMYALALTRAARANMIFGYLPCPIYAAKE